MRNFVRTAAVFGLAGALVVGGALAAGAGELCPMGGVMFKVAVDKEKALEWFDDEKLGYLVNEDDGWMVTTFNSKSDRIGAVWGEDYIFYGVADDREDEVSDRAMTKAFGNDLKNLKAAVLNEFRELRKKQIIDIEGSDVAKASDAVALGTLSKDDGEWVLETSDCEGMTVNVDEID